MSRTRVGLGIIAVAAGTAWAFGGIGFVSMLSLKLAELLPFFLIIAGVSATLRLLVPKGALVGPVILIVAGLLGITAEHHLLTPSLHYLPALILILVGAFVAMSKNPTVLTETGVRRNNAFFFPRILNIPGRAPRKVITRAIFTLSRLDLSQASFPPATRLWIDVTCILGRTEIVLPKGWEVQAGRVTLARHVIFSGTLTRGNIASMSEEDDSEKDTIVVINVLGWRGAVTVEQPELRDGVGRSSCPAIGLLNI